MTDFTEPQNPTFIDNPQAPDLFADSCTGLFVANGSLRITLGTLRVNHVTSPGPISHVVVGRLVMPVTSAEALAHSILKFLKNQRAEMQIRAN